MEPRAIGAEVWDQISRALIYLFLFTGLGLTGAISFLFGGAMLPSLIDSRDVPVAFTALRWLTYPVCTIALLLAAYALLRALLIAVAVAQQIYPRAWI
jgi:hypothetical protein